MNYPGLLIRLACAASAFVTPATAENLNVLPKGANSLLYGNLLQQSKQLYATRATEVEAALQSPEAALERGQKLLRDYRRIIGQLPQEKTPLHAEITGIIECDGYRIENVVFESRPNHHVTANLYVPTTGKGPFPGVAMPCGHSATGWMKQWLMDNPMPVVEPGLKLQTDKALGVTRTGQVITAFKDESTVAGMNLARARDLAEERAQFWKNGDSKTCLAEVKRLIGFIGKREKAEVNTTDIIKRDNYRIEKLIIQRDGEVPLPALLFVPGEDGPKRPATVYVDGRGKSQDAAPGGGVEALVRSGRIVLSIDVAGFGETADRGSNG